MNTDGIEAAPVYNAGKTVISPLTGLPMSAAEFSHNNMVPFYRGEIKQNMTDDANRTRLDHMIGTGYLDIGKREQAPLFEPHREPTGNVNGLESFTDFAQDRVIVSQKRTSELPMDKVQVGPGLNQGFTAFPTGGFQQFDIQEIAKQRLSVDEMRYASDPKITYDNPLIMGKAVNDMPAQIGEVRKYSPDTFFLNENGERNFVTAGENTKPMERAAQVMKFQSRQETNIEAIGPAASADFSATYTVPSFRSPRTHQNEGPGFRNADGSSYGVANTDAPHNDFGRQGYALPTNQRNVTGERGQTLNLVTTGPKALTVYDPSDVARTTIRETTGSTDWVGVAAPAAAPTKLTVYDPTDITRVTGRNTLAEPDRALNVTRVGAPGAGTLGLADVVRATTKAGIAAQPGYAAPAGPATVAAAQVYDYAYNMHQNPTKELVASGRRPIAGNGQMMGGLFNGQDSMNMTSRKIDTDFLNDRATTADRVVGPPLGADAIGIQRPRQPLHMDISRDRNISAILDSLNDNPYALPVHKIAQGAPPGYQPGPAAMALMAAPM
jgi:hypothetical protein